MNSRIVDTIHTTCYNFNKYDILNNLPLWTFALITCFIVGLNDIQRWIRVSLKTTPFSLITGKDWTLRSSKTDLRDVYTKLSLAQIKRRANGVERKELDDITTLLREIQKGEESEPIRILVQGNRLLKILPLRD